MVYVVFVLELEVGCTESVYEQAETAGRFGFSYKHALWRLLILGSAVPIDVGDKHFLCLWPFLFAMMTSRIPSLRN